jgi:hypothetical protein
VRLGKKSKLWLNAVNAADYPVRMKGRVALGTKYFCYSLSVLV